MITISEQDRAMALIVAKDILKRYKYPSPEVYTAKVLELANVFIEWMEIPDIDDLTFFFPEIF